MKIYTITTLRAGAWISGGLRNIGFFPTAEEAKIEVENNSCDMYEEGYYPFVVIEEYGPGIYYHPKQIQWYEWNREKGGYVEIDMPDRFKQTCNFGIG